MSIKRMQELAGVKSNQTAIEWFAETVHKMGYVSSNILEQAKEMEKEQITDAYYMGSQDAPIKKGQSEEYYNDTFK
jgi:hypothetical protein